jgi:predicted nuclease with TOPRIM domain
MTAIKDIIDLTMELRNKVKDRQLAAEITRIQTLISALQSEHFTVIEKKTQLLSENSDLKNQISDCKSKVAILEKEISDLNRKHSEEITQLTEKYNKAISEMRHNQDKGSFGWEPFT